MAVTRYLSTDKLIENIKVRGMLPESQVTIREQDFLDFANEEMDLGVVPHVLLYHENYLLVERDVKIQPNQNRYPIPHRAVGNKLKDVAYVDNSGNIYQMTRIQLDDLPYEQFSITTGMNKFYVDVDEIVVVPVSNYAMDGYFRFYFYMRPNQLVTEDRVTKLTSIDYNKGIFTVANIPDSFQGITSFDITSSKSPFRLAAEEVVPTQLGTTSTLTYTFGIAQIYNMLCSPKASITPGSFIVVNDNTSGLALNYSFWFDITGSDTPSSDAVGTLVRVDLSASTTATDVATAISAVMVTTLPSTILPSSAGALLTLAGAGLGVSVGPNFTLSNNNPEFTVTLAQAGTNFLPRRLNVGDILALPEETIIPQIPVELHSMLSQRVVMRCLEALGDTQGLTNATTKLQEMEVKTGSIIDDRVEDAPQKIVNRIGNLRVYRRYFGR